MYKGKKCYGMKDLNAQKKKLDLSFLIKMYETANKKEDFFNSFFDKLAGTDQLRKQIEKGLSQEEIRLSWQKDIEKFKKIREKYLLYQ